MAYLNFSEIAGAPAIAAELRRAEPGLTPLEWSVVALAQRDTLASLSEPGRVSIALGAVFGGRRHNPRLADPRLEALRRMSVLAWHRGYSVPPSELRAFEAAGFSEDQYEVLQASIGRGRAARNRKN